MSLINYVNSSFVEWRRPGCLGLKPRTTTKRELEEIDSEEENTATVVKEINRRGCKDLTAGCYLSFLWGKFTQIHRCHSCQLEITGFSHNY